MAISQNKKNIRLNQYAGQWVAFMQEKIIEHSEDLKTLMSKIDKKGLRKKASIFLVPRKDEGPYIL